MFLKLSLVLFVLKTVYSQDWSYNDDWTEKFESCGSNSQSPINIQESTTVYDKKLMKFNFFNYNRTLNWTAVNDGKTIDANTNSEIPYITGSDFSENFTFIGFHFHWGKDKNEGSEHFLNGQKFPLEVHLVHQSESKNLAVLGFFFEISEKDNENLADLISVVDLKINDSKKFEYRLDSMIPDKEKLNSDGYFRYNGSLTTPPCTESVIWTVFKTKIPISKNQLEKFYQTGIEKNFRPIQNLSARIVTRSFINSSSKQKAKFSLLIIISTFLYLIRF